MKVGDLVKYNDKYTTGLLIGIVLQVSDEQEGNFACSDVRVRWIDHLDSQRDWYDLEELILLCKSVT